MSDILEAPPDPPDKVPATPPSPRPTPSTPPLGEPDRAALAPTRKALWTFAGVGALASVVGLLAGPSAQTVVGPLLPLVVAGTLVSVVLAARSHRRPAGRHATGPLAAPTETPRSATSSDEPPRQPPAPGQPDPSGPVTAG
jgi:hypothetical protein